MADPKKDAKATDKNWLKVPAKGPKPIEAWIMQKDPLVARGESGISTEDEKKENRIGLSKVLIKGETTVGIGPTSSRIAVVDFDFTHDKVLEGAQLHSSGERFKVSFKFDKAPDSSVKTVSNLSEKEIAQIESDIHFHQVNVWATVHSTMTLLEQPDILGRRIPWAFDSGRIKILPHACYEENAWYDRESQAICFGYYYNKSELVDDLPDDQLIFTCLSHDVITHELGHAILDGLKPYYLETTSPANGGFHEYFGDAIAITSSLANRELVVQVAGRDDAVLKKKNPIACIAKELGQTLGFDKDFLRSAQNDKDLDDLTEEEMFSEHDYSVVLTGAYYDLLERIYMHRIKLLENDAGKDADKSDGISGGMRVNALLGAAGITRRMMLRALDYCPPVDLNYLDYARAVYRADEMAFPSEPDLYRQMWLWVCIERKICKTIPKGYKDAGRDPIAIAREEIDPPAAIKNSEFRGLDIDKLSASETDAYDFIDLNRDVLDLPRTANIEVINLYRTNKTSVNDYRVPTEIIIEFVWANEVKLANEEGKSGPLEFGELENTYAKLWCGGTLVFSREGNLLHYTVKNENESRKRAFVKYMAHLYREGYIDVAQPEKGLGASMHRKFTATITDGKVSLKSNSAMRCRGGRSNGN